MQYMLMFYETAHDVGARTDPARVQSYWAGWQAYVEALRASGIVVNGDGLEPPATATSVRLRAGKRQVQDGPFIDSKEQLGGYFIINAANLDAALDWASRAPCAGTGGVEVRPVMPPPGA